MSENPTDPAEFAEPEADRLREHTQEPAEGPDEDAALGDDVPRVHPEEPAEG